MDQIKNHSKKSVEENENQAISPPLILIPTGSVLLNLACSNSKRGGFGAGKMANLIGDSSSGKTLLALSMFAEVAKLKQFKDYHLVYDDVEHACEFNIEELFGKYTAKRIEAPTLDMESGFPMYSDTIQDFHSYIGNLIANQEPFIYVLDSFDALTSEEEQDKTEEMWGARKIGKKISGSYGMEKAKFLGQILRQIIEGVKKINSFLLIISQTRDNINPISFVKKTRSGGNALRFYASHEIWLAVAGKIRKNNKIIGTNIKAKVTKNKLTGKLREVEFPVYYDYGIDDIGACVDLLINEGVWEKKKTIIDAVQFNMSGTRSKLIRQIEQEKMQKKLFELVGDTWLQIEKSLRLDRIPKY